MIPITEQKLKNFLKHLEPELDKTLICAGGIADKYNLNIQGKVNLEQEIKKITDTKDRLLFQKSKLNDDILTAQYRMLAWIYKKNYRKNYTSDV